MTDVGAGTFEAETLGREVHVWRVRLDLEQGQVPELLELLSVDERQRMERLHTDLLRRRFCVARGALRLLLGEYLGVEAQRVAFDYGEHGKPSVAASLRVLTDLQNAPDVRFNLSHSEEEALLAVTLGMNLGVDIQQVKAGVDFQGIARRFLSEAEVRRLFELPQASQPEAFFECWTRKESYLKACGGGLQLPLDGFDVDFGPGTPAKLLRVGWDAGEVARWEMADLEVAEGFCGAITMERCGRALRYMNVASFLRCQGKGYFSQ